MTEKLYTGVCLCPEIKKTEKRPLSLNALLQDVLQITGPFPMNLVAL